MSTVTPTLIPRAPYFPTLLPDLPKPHPSPLPPYYGRPLGFNYQRQLINEIDDLSDEERDIEDYWKTYVKNRNFDFMHVIGRLYTQHEEKNDQAESDSDDSGSAHSGVPASNAEDGENDSAQDLDANMDDLDDEAGDLTGDLTGETEELEIDDAVDDLDDEYDEEPDI